MHCYSATRKELQACLDMNFYISLAGPVTFKNAKEVKEVAKVVPLDKLLIETDAPYLAPHPYRGKRNEPAYVSLVAKEIAALREIEYEKRSEEHTSELQSRFDLVCRLLLEKKKIL